MTRRPCGYGKGSFSLHLNTLARKGLTRIRYRTGKPTGHSLTMNTAHPDLGQNGVVCGMKMPHHQYIHLFGDDDSGHSTAVLMPAG
jgi:hypothetical protein